MRESPRGYPMPMCDYPDCEEEATNFEAGTFPGDIEPAQWCDEHYNEMLIKGQKQIKRFQKRRKW